MAYSDYAGFAYKNGIRDESRSDVELSVNGLRSTPGEYPGFTVSDTIQKAENFHVLLGSGPVYVGLYKQTNVSIRRGNEEVEDLYCESDAFLQRQIDDVLIEIHFEITDNLYQYVRVTEPDGTVWTGFSGYGVGTKLESGELGCSAAECARRLETIFLKNDEGRI